MAILVINREQNPQLSGLQQTKVLCRSRIVAVSILSGTGCISTQMERQMNDMPVSPWRAHPVVLPTAVMPIRQRMSDLRQLSAERGRFPCIS